MSHDVVRELVRMRLGARFDTAVRAAEESGTGTSVCGLLFSLDSYLDRVPGDRYRLSRSPYCVALLVLPGDVPPGRWPSWAEYNGELFANPKRAADDPDAAIYCRGERYVLVLR